MANENKVWPAALLLAAVLIIGLLINTSVIINAVKDNSQAKIDLSKVATKTDLNTVESSLGAKIASVENSVNQSAEADRLDQAVNSILSTDDEKLKVKEIADEYLTSKDFKKALAEFLNTESQNVESYKDISSIVIKDSDMTYRDSKDKATVDYELKVTYFNDGDDDEEDAVKARLSVTLNLDELEEDLDFEDANTEESDFALIKVY
jgi:hypothetical protein